MTANADWTELHQRIYDKYKNISSGLNMSNVQWIVSEVIKADRKAVLERVRKPLLEVSSSIDICLNEFKYFRETNEYRLNDQRLIDKAKHNINIIDRNIAALGAINKALSEIDLAIDKPIS